MFSITQSKGFGWTMPNGYKLSVQFGPGNYGDNYDMHQWPEQWAETVKRSEVKSRCAEVAIIDPENNMFIFDADGKPDYATVLAGWVRPEEVFRQLSLMAALPTFEPNPHS